MIIAQNCKRKNAVLGKIEWERIPVCPMLAPFLEGLDEIDIYSADTMRRKFHQILPNHTLKDMRRTFYSMCDNQNVDERAKNEMVGHAKNSLVEAYQELSDEFLSEEAKKIVTGLRVEPITPMLPPKKDRFGLAKKTGKAQKSSVYSRTAMLFRSGGSGGRLPCESQRPSGQAGARMMIHQNTLISPVSSILPYTL